MFKIGNKYLYNEFINDNLVESTIIIAESETKTSYRFSRESRDIYNTHYNIGKDIFPEYSHRTGINDIRKVKVVEILK